MYLKTFIKHTLGGPGIAWVSSSCHVFLGNFEGFLWKYSESCAEEGPVCWLSRLIALAKTS